MKKVFLSLFVLLFFCQPMVRAQESTRWTIQPDGSIKWVIGKDIPHSDKIEMSGLGMSAVLRYGVTEDGTFTMERTIVWPALRTIPNNTHGSLTQRFAIDYPSMLIVNGHALKNEKVKSVQLDGKLTVVSEYPSVELTRVYFPSTDKPLLCEQYEVKNISNRKVSILIPHSRTLYHTDASLGVDGSYRILATLENPPAEVVYLESGESFTFSATIQAGKQNEEELQVDVTAERKAREDFVSDRWSKLVLDSPDEVINTAFAFAKIRASESIFATEGGLMHGPGGEAYYAAIWANDQAEYMNPLFPFLGYPAGDESALNSFRHFARFMNPEYKPIPSSIIAEGKDTWHGAGDRGDGAMIAYGAARYALAKGDKDEANRLWPLIEWCLAYCDRKLTPEGVVASDSDELENRFPSGDANLCTSTLYYDALLSAVFLGKELNKPASRIKEYGEQAKALRKAIESYFGAVVEGFDTYRYYDGNDVLRSWICMPLTVDIFDRKAGTIDALFSPRLWTENGLLTQAGTDTFWDRSTLYGLRGTFAAGAREQALMYLHSYSVKRLLGDRVPYPIEAWPEGDQRHLSAESGLYCRVVTEGLFGIRPTGFNRFTVTPQLPENWDFMTLKNIEAFGNGSFDIYIERKGNGIKMQIKKNEKVVKTYTARNGDAIQVKL